SPSPSPHIHLRRPRTSSHVPQPHGPTRVAAVRVHALESPATVPARNDHPTREHAARASSLPATHASCRQRGTSQGHGASAQGHHPGPPYRPNARRISSGVQQHGA
ncbi:hypothetical protein PLICRDRAFT_47496, partial [Plicaturopsis crispa FD-325 SS-3]